MIKVSELEKLDASCEEAPWELDDTRVYNSALSGEVYANGVGFWEEDDLAMAVAARNALPALLRLARAAADPEVLIGLEFANMEESPPGVWDKQITELRAALAPFDFTD